MTDVEISFERLMNTLPTYCGPFHLAVTDLYYGPDYNASGIMFDVKAIGDLVMSNITIQFCIGSIWELSLDVMTMIFFVGMEIIGCG